MNKINVKKLDINIYEEKLENGLEIFICKTPGFNKKMAYFQTKYGSVNNEFIPIGEKEYKKYPLGIAHFLEHKLFENEEKKDYFKLFQQNGAYINAATSYDKTYYYFVCTEKFNENLINLIELVQNPYFTDENVEKEKGIIIQELEMYKNDPSYNLFRKTYNNLFVKDYKRYDVGGTIKDVESITKEQLYDCYNTFYNPSNMFLTIVGDVDEKEVIKILKQTQKDKQFKENKVKLKKIVEPKRVYKKEDIIYSNVESEKVSYAYKVKIDNDLKDLDKLKRNFYISTFIKTKFGSLSEFDEYLIKNKIVKSYFDYTFNIYEDYLILCFEADIIDDKKLSNEIEKRLKDFNNLQKEFELYKKTAISNKVKTAESPSSICSSIRDFYSKYDRVLDDFMDVFDLINYEEYIEYLKTLDFSNKVKVIMKKEG